MSRRSLSARHAASPTSSPGWAMRSDAMSVPGPLRIRSWSGLWSDWASGRRGRWRQVVLWSVVALILLRLLAPWILTRIANNALADGDEVRGSISGLSLGLLTCN